MPLAAAMLFVNDLERMTAFYRDVLELQPIEETRLVDWIEFRADGVRFSLHAIPAAVAAEVPIESPPAPREQSSVKLTFTVPDVEAALKKIQQMGLPVTRREWGATEAIDPEGNIFVISCEPN